jgi:hypothetical protein
MTAPAIAITPSTRSKQVEPVRDLLACGILASLLYAAMNVFIPLQWEGYSSASQTVSELSAIGAPTRALWVVFGTIYTVVFVAFGWGVWLYVGAYLVWVVVLASTLRGRSILSERTVS